MLVLGRKTNESLIISGGIIITILGIEGDRVKVGIDAPRDITILRAEVRDRQARANGEHPTTPPTPTRRAS
jgi:carbon storage regulator